MIRQRSTTRQGYSFGTSTVDTVWQKAQVVLGCDATRVRKDACGAWIARDQYGQTSSNGWEIDHIVPVAAGGPDTMDNLQPLHWENNRHKGDSFPGWRCALTAAA